METFPKSCSTEDWNLKDYIDCFDPNRDSGGYNQDEVGSGERCNNVQYCALVGLNHKNNCVNHYYESNFGIQKKNETRIKLDNKNTWFDNKFKT